MFLAEVSYGLFLVCMVGFSALSWFFGWVLGRTVEPAQVGTWRQRLAERDMEVTSKTNELARVRNGIEESERRFLVVQKQLQERDEEAQRMAQSRSALAGQLDASQQELAALKGDYEPLKARVVELEPLGGEVQQLTAQVRDLEPQLEKAHAEHEALLKQNVSLSDRVAQLEPIVERQEQQILAISPFEKQYRESESKRQELDEALKARNQEIASLRERMKQLEPLRAEIVSRDEKIRALTPYEEKYTESEARRKSMVAEHENSMRTKTREIEALKGQLRELEPLRAGIVTRDEKIRALTPYQTKFTESEARRKSMVAEHENSMRTKTREIETLRGQLRELEPLRAQLAQRDQRIRALETIEREHSGCGETIRALQRRLNSDAGRRPAPTTPRTPDDLKKIHGIGRVFERQLNNMGFLTFGDLATWDRPQIERVAEAIGSFPDRIERDRWVEQAKQFANR